MSAIPVRTSQTHPLQIAQVSAGRGDGLVGITFCPGKHQSHAATGAWRRDPSVDLDVIKAWGADILVTLVTSDELQALQVPDLGAAVETRAMRWMHLPIEDYSTPDAAWESAWVAAAPAIHATLDAGGRVVVHCKGGLGRAGLVAARMLIERGTPASAAIARVRQVRPGAIETGEQAQYLRDLPGPRA